MQIKWRRQHAIDSILDWFKILPVPVHLVPDANVSHFLRHPLVNTGSISKVFLEWVVQYLSESGVRCSDVERVLRGSLAAYPEHGGLLRVSDRAFEMSDRIGRLLSRFILSALGLVKRRVRKVLDR
jgi:hypothetical protein